MRIVLVELSLAEAQDATVMRNIVSMLEGSDVQLVAPSLPQVPGKSVPPVADAAPQLTAPVAETPTPQMNAAAVFAGAPGAIVHTLSPAGAAAHTTMEQPGAMPPAPPQAPKGEVDKRGFPWDERIHSEPPAKTDKGEWRAKRNTKDLKPIIEAELRLAGFGVVTPPPPPATPQTPALTPEQIAALAAAQAQAGTPIGALAGTMPPAPTPMPMPPAPSPMPQAPAGGIEARPFASLMLRAHTAVQAGKVPHSWLKDSYTPYGIVSMQTLMQRGDVVEILHQMLDDLGITNTPAGLS
jgi:hypothetical protein